MPPPILLGLALFTGFFLRAVSAECFFPNNAVAADHMPCTSPSGTHTCCAPGFECLSNGLCNDLRYENFTRVLRGACTDKDWGSGCVSACKEPWTDRDQQVSYCGDSKWCCDGAECCKTANEAAMIDLGEPDVVGVASNTSSGTEHTTTWGFPTGSSTYRMNPKQRTSGPNMVAVGVGVGLGGAVLVGVAIAVFCIMRRRLRRRARKMEMQELPDNSVNQLEWSSGANGNGKKHEVRGDAPLPGELSSAVEPKEMYVLPGKDGVMTQEGGGGNGEESAGREQRETRREHDDSTFKINLPGA